MSALWILGLGIIVSTVTGFGAFLIGLQEDGDRKRRSDEKEAR